MSLDKRYTLSGDAVRQLSADHDRLRGTPVRPPFSRSAPEILPMGKQVMIGLAEEEIGPVTTDPEPTLASGQVRIYYLKDDGTLGQSSEAITAYNFTASNVLSGGLVHLARDPWSKRWMIVGVPAAGRANIIYFEATESFTTASQDFTADILHYFGGDDPRPARWASDNHGTIINPPVNSGASFFFSGASGDHGFAVWHDDDAVTPGADVGYWCFQLRCQA